MAVRWKQVMTMLLKGVSQSGTARAAHCSKRDVSRAARVIRECSVDSALLASLSDREVAERWFPARPRERAEGYLHPDLDACVERKGAYRRLPLKLLWYEYRDSAGREGLKAYSYQAFCRMFAARGAVGRDRAFGARAGRQGVHRLDRRLPASDRSGHWPAHEGAGVRRRAPVLGADLRPGDAGPARGVMAGGAPKHAGVVRGRAEHARPGPVRDCGRPHAPRVDGDSRQQAVSGIRRALRDRGRAGARVQATRQGAGAGRPWTWSSGGSSSPRGMRRSARSRIPDDYIGERVMWLNRRHATPGRDSRRERYRGRGTTDAAALLPAEPSGPCQWRKAKVLSDTAISASRRMILLRAPRTGAGGPWT